MVLSIFAIAAVVVAFDDSPPLRDEIWVDTNNLKVFVKGKWEDVPLDPITQSTCESGNPRFLRYCP